MTDWQTLALGSGFVASAIAGWTGFSNFVMPAPSTPPTQGAVPAMHAIDRAATTPAFVPTLLGSASAGKVWTRDNTVRGLASVASAGAYAEAMVGR